MPTPGRDLFFSTHTALPPLLTALTVHGDGSISPASLHRRVRLANELGGALGTLRHERLLLARLGVLLPLRAVRVRAEAATSTLRR